MEVKDRGVKKKGKKKIVFHMIISNNKTAFEFPSKLFSAFLFMASKNEDFSPLIIVQHFFAPIPVPGGNTQNI